MIPADSSDHKKEFQILLKELEDYGVIFKEMEVPYLGYNPLNVKN